MDVHRPAYAPLLKLPLTSPCDCGTSRTSSAHSARTALLPQLRPTSANAQPSSTAVVKTSTELSDLQQRLPVLAHHHHHPSIAVVPIPHVRLFVRQQGFQTFERYVQTSDVEREGALMLTRTGTRCWITGSTELSLHRGSLYLSTLQRGFTLLHQHGTNQLCSGSAKETRSREVCVGGLRVRKRRSSVGTFTIQM